MIVELRQYTTHLGQRDVLIELFDREFIESQEAEGMSVLGQFRDVDNPDRFVWLRGFAEPDGRADALTRFYTGPVWRAHSAAANATMVDVSDVLLLEPATDLGWPGHTSPRPPAGVMGDPPQSLITATLCHRDHPFDDASRAVVTEHVRLALIAAGGEPIGLLRTAYVENAFPALPVRTGEHVLVWVARFADATAYRDPAVPGLAHVLTGAPQILRLAPTARSRLR